MLRFVAAPDGMLVFDAAATLPGRGMWLSAGPDVIEKALKRGVFPRAAGVTLRIPADLQAQVRSCLERRVAELLGLARRSASAVSGFEKAREWLLLGKAGLIVQAADGSPEERARFLGGRDIAAVAPLDAASLGRVFGRERAVHVAIASGRLATMIATDSRRLADLAGPVAGAEANGQTARDEDIKRA
jgi:uncharacterized protein